MSDRISEIRARCEAATPGPWKQVEQADYSVVDVDAENGPNIAMVGSSPADAAFIAHAREDIPYLLEQLAEAAAEVERLRAIENEVAVLNSRVDAQMRLFERAWRWIPVRERLPEEPTREDIDWDHYKGILSYDFGRYNTNHFRILRCRRLPRHG